MASRRIVVLGLVVIAAGVSGYLLWRSAQVKAIGTIFPSHFVIDGLVLIDQLGASLWEVARDWRRLWILALVYFVLAVMSAGRRHGHG